MSQRMEVDYAPLGVEVGQEVALLRFVPFAGILERLQPFGAGFPQVEADHLGGVLMPLAGPEKGVGRFPGEEGAQGVGKVIG
ncbi:MAG: hypothetical protein U0793_20155 [Gemmataceae bacterium]